MMEKHMSRFKGKVVLVSGGAGGIGAAAAIEMAGEGATVVLGDLPGGEGRALAQRLEGEFVELDVTREEAWRAVVADIVQRHGTVDVLVNAAGIEGDVIRGALELTSLAEWRRVLSVNLDGTFLGCREVMGPMKKAGQGAIVNVSSIGAYYPTVQGVAYGASKGAVTQFTKSVALDGSQGDKRVRCNSVHPGMIATRMLDSINSQLDQRESGAGRAATQQSAQRMPMGGPGEPQDVAKLIAFLASDDARYITGSEYAVDGGWRLLR